MRERTENSGFNPCFSGYGIQTSSTLCYWYNGFEFQSLFFWIWNSDIKAKLADSSAKCFNPCFSGYGIQTYLSSIPRLSTHVSILVFLDMEFRLHHNVVQMLDYEFQSLFFWIWNSDGSRKLLSRWVVLFQSLFFWIWNSDMLYKHWFVNRY